MEEGITWAGLDAHKSAINVAAFVPGSARPVEWQLANDGASVRRMVRKVARMASGDVRFCFEAGPCGYSLQRQINESVSCMVVAPALIPRKPGERIKTDRRDARKLGELFRAGLLTEVHPPSPENESARDLCRPREDVRGDLMSSRHRLGKLLLRRGILFDAGKKAWTQRHRTWLRGLRFELPADRKVFDDYLLAVEQLEERQRGLDEAIEQLSQQMDDKEGVGALRCFRGIDTTTAMTIVTELLAPRSGPRLRCWRGPAERSAKTASR
jgi:transposase